MDLLVCFLYMCEHTHIYVKKQMYMYTYVFIEAVVGLHIYQYW